MHAGPVLVPADAKPSLYLPFVPVQLLGESLQLPPVWTLRRTKQDSVIRHVVRRRGWCAATQNKNLSAISTKKQQHGEWHSPSQTNFL
uniref:Uncharacterized protein n=1 Tax=Kryptolebias marmoratus TaxID=37003 RepID=A0A3Q3BE20_KRYMA